MFAKIAVVNAAVVEGETVANACRSVGVSEPSYYRWRTRFLDESAGSEPPATRAMRLRDVMIRSAKSVFLRDGFNANLDDVAAAAGVARQTVYNQFGGKKQLFAEVVQLIYLENVSPALVLESDSDLSAMLTKCARHLVDLMLDPDAVGLLRITLSEHRGHPELARLAYALRASRAVPTVAGVIAERLETEMSRGTIEDIDSQLSAEIFVDSFAATPRHRALLGFARPSDAKIELRIRTAVNLFVKGIGYRPPPPAVGTDDAPGARLPVDKPG